MEKTTLRGRRFPSSSFFHGQGGGASGFPSSPPSLVLDQREGRLEARLLGAAVGVLAGRQVEAVRVLLELLGRLGRGVGEPFEFLRSNFCVRFISVFEGAGRGRLDVSARGFVRGGFFVSGVKRTVSRRLRAELWTGGRPRRAGPGTRPPPPARSEKSQGAGRRDVAVVDGGRARVVAVVARSRPSSAVSRSLSLSRAPPTRQGTPSIHSQRLRARHQRLVLARALGVLLRPGHAPVERRARVRARREHVVRDRLQLGRTQLGGRRHGGGRSPFRGRRRGGFWVGDRDPRLCRSLVGGRVRSRAEVVVSSLCVCVCDDDRCVTGEKGGDGFLRGDGRRACRASAFSTRQSDVLCVYRRLQRKHNLLCDR